MPEHYLPSFQEKGRPCPRVEVDPDNHVAAGLAWMTIQEPFRPLSLIYGPAAMAGYTPDQVVATINRVTQAIQDKEVVEKFFPKPESSRPHHRPPRRHR